MTSIRVIRTIVHTYEVPFDDEYYPNMSLKQAEDYEKSFEIGDVIALLDTDEDITINTTIEILGKDD